MRMWLRYEKGEAAKYISHLDFLRAITRTIRRAHIPVKYSEGFNPHMKLSFALALPLGTTSVTELMEIELNEDLTPEEILEKLNKESLMGIRFIEAGISPDKNKFKAIGFAKYKVTPDKMITEDELSAFLAKDEIVTMKKTKSGTKPTDIRGDIASIKIEGGSLIMILSAGNDANLKPETVLSAMKENIEGFSFEDYDSVRTGILDKTMAYI